MNDITKGNFYITLSGGMLITFELNLKNKVMPLLTILIVLVVAGVLLWLVNSYIPMDSKIKTILNVVVVIVVIIWLLKAFGILTALGNINV
ncbi:MAG: Thivi_2564 family membrane protein [Lentimicrobium sp.]